jgi:hypothetical protein
MHKQAQATCDAIRADLEANGPATPATIARRMGRSDSRSIRNMSARMVRAGILASGRQGVLSLTIPDASPFGPDLELVGFAELV